MQAPTTDGTGGLMMKMSRDDGATWDVLECMGIAQMLPDGAKNTCGILVSQGNGQARRAPPAV